jgi:uncharacterized protein (UPF0333 family)
MGKKGLELPLNMIVLIIIAVLVLLVVAAFFTGQFISGASTIELQKAFSNACPTLKNVYNCQNTGFTVGEIKGLGPNPTFLELCNELYKSISADIRLTKCKQDCGCSIT